MANDKLTVEQFKDLVLSELWDLQGSVQDMRESGEGDMRSVIYAIDRVISEVKRIG